MIRTINSFIEQTSCPGFATERNAMIKAELLVTGDATASVVVLQRKRDGRWVPVVINPDVSPGYYAANGAVVWS